jgi:hypothetical protein
MSPSFQLTHRYTLNHLGESSHWCPIRTFTNFKLVTVYHTLVMADNQSTNRYDSPRVTEYGSVEAITEQSNKEGNASDQYSDNTPLVGSIVPA